MNGEEAKLKYLEFIQGAIDRMANNSFLLKGWCVTLVSALFALAAKDSNPKFLYVTFIPVIMFWILDAYFLRQERLFRKKYDEVRYKISQGEAINFSLDTSKLASHVQSWLSTFLSITLVIFYWTMLGVIWLVGYLIFQV
jgi:hypothetical protein